MLDVYWFPLTMNSRNYCPESLSSYIPMVDFFARDSSDSDVVSSILDLTVSMSVMLVESMKNYSDSVSLLNTGIEHIVFFVIVETSICGMASVPNHLRKRSVSYSL